MNFKETWAKWEKEEKERKPEYNDYQWVDRNGYVHNKTSEVWHLSIYDFLITLKNSAKISVVLYVCYIAMCFFFIIMGNKHMHIPSTFLGHIEAVLRLFIIIAIIRSYKYIARLITTVLGIILLFCIAALLLTTLFFAIRAVV